MKPIATALLTAMTLLSCATTGDLDKIRQEMALVQQSNRETTEALQKFLIQYDADLRMELEKNVSQIQTEINRLEAVKAEAEESSRLIAGFRRASEADSLQTAANRRESDSQNVIREFTALKTQWDRQLDLLTLRAETAEKAARDAQSQIRDARSAVREVEEKLLRLEALGKKLNQWSGEMEDYRTKTDQTVAAVRVLKQDLADLQTKLEDLKKRISVLETP